MTNDEGPMTNGPRRDTCNALSPAHNDKASLLKHDKSAG